jgi:transcriptional regulator with XRE-family HTH domain
VAVQFGKDLRRFRNGVGVSQEGLGFLAALHRTEISLLERGLREPKLDTIIKLAGTLGVTLNELCDGISWKLEGSDLREFEFRDLRDAATLPVTQGLGD